MLMFTLGLLIGIPVGVAGTFLWWLHMSNSSKR